MDAGESAKFIPKNAGGFFVRCGRMARLEPRPTNRPGRARLTAIRLRGIFAQELPTRSAGFQTCCAAGFQACTRCGWLRSADLEIGGTAGLETCGTARAESVENGEASL